MCEHVTHARRTGWWIVFQSSLMEAFSEPYWIAFQLLFPFLCLVLTRCRNAAKSWSFSLTRRRSRLSSHGLADSSMHLSKSGCTKSDDAMCLQTPVGGMHVSNQTTNSTCRPSIMLVGSANGSTFHISEVFALLGHHDMVDL